VETAELRYPAHLHSGRDSVAESVSVNPLQKSDGGNAPYVAENKAQITRFKFGAQKMFPKFDKEVKKSVTETLLLSIFVCDRVSVRYDKNVTDLGISECVTDSVSVNSIDKSDGGNAP
jgi:hypothetical protein